MQKKQEPTSNSAQIFFKIPNFDEVWKKYQLRTPGFVSKTELSEITNSTGFRKKICGTGSSQKILMFLQFRLVFKTATNKIKEQENYIF